jgi:hypothetical protein
MANLAKIKRRNKLGTPPSFEEASKNLTAPEIVPLVVADTASSPKSIDTPPQWTSERVDGRSLRKTGRTIQFATRVSQEYDDKFRSIAVRDKLEFCVLLEKCLDAYELVGNR